MRRSRFATLVLLLAAGTPLAQASLPKDAALQERLEEYLAPWMERNWLSGTVVIADDERILASFTHGVSGPEGGPLDPEGRFLVGSVSKSVTATAVLLLVEAGALSLDDTLDEFLPDFPKARAIAVRQLLLHGSGVGDVDPAEAYRSHVDLEGLIAHIATRPFHFEPGTDDRYSNSGYALLARVVEEASGVPFAEFLRTEVFAPLEMDRSGEAAETPRPEGLVEGSIPVPGPEWRRFPTRPDPGFLIGGGSVFSTTADLLRFARAVAKDFPVRWQDLEWPYGWGRIEVGGHRGLEQTGAVTGFNSCLVVLPTAERFVVVLLNQELGGWMHLGRAAAALALGEEPPEPDLPIPIELPASDLSRFTGRFEGDGFAFAIEVQDGALWQRPEGWTLARYLMPVGAADLAIPADLGVLRFADPDATGSFGRVVWDVGPSSPEFRRASGR